MRIGVIAGWLIAASLIFQACLGHRESDPEVDGSEPSEAGRALDDWYTARMDPDGRLSVGPWVRAYMSALGRSGDQADWVAIGPKNIGGRTLCIAFDPLDADVIWAGSASGGLWRSHTGGAGAQAWQRVPVGFPVLGISSILIDPADPDRMWIGTGEMYNHQAASPGTINRFTRGTYGIGILKSVDGGQSWSVSLDWTDTDLRSVQRIAMNPEDPSILLAATSHGLYRSDNGGDDWRRLFDQSMITDVWIDPADTARVLLAAGSFWTPGAGIYRSVDGGATFALVDDGIPTGFSGKAMFGPAPTDADRIYCSVANAESGIGLFVSQDAGSSWNLVNTLDVPKFQGWYSHALAVSPSDPDYLLYGGVDMHRSANGGQLLVQTSYWEEWLFGQVPAGGPEGPPYYVHADIHAIAWHPSVPGQVWIATDGGLFVSNDDGQNYSGRNGGYQTQQFYPRFSSSSMTKDLAIGGMQDNATALFVGDGDWVRVVGGDGMCTAIDPTDDNRMLASAQFLNIFRSLDKGGSFDPVSGTAFVTEESPFNGAFQIDPGNPDKVYAGGQRLSVSTDFAGQDSWQPVGPDPLDNGNLLTGIDLSPVNSLHILVRTASDPLATNGAQTGSILRSPDGGKTWTKGIGLPTRLCTDLAFHPLGDTVLATFSGFSDQPLYRSSDGGLTWAPFGTGLPPIPTNCVMYDPYESRHVYVGNDLGVYVSTNGGATFSTFREGLPDATLVMDLSVSLPKQTIRAATHGLGAFESPLVSTSPVVIPEGSGTGIRLLGNPVTDGTLRLMAPDRGIQGGLRAEWSDLQGRRLASRAWTEVPGSSLLIWTLPEELARTGVFLLTLSAPKGHQTYRVLVLE